MPHQSVAVLFRRDVAIPRHVISSSAAQLFKREDDLLVVPDPGSDARLTFSDGQVAAVAAATYPIPLMLTGWHLAVDERAPEATKHHQIELASLKDWRDIPELKDAVGSAIYTATLQVPPDWFGSDRSQLLTVGEVAGAMQLSVNGHVVTEQTVGNGQWLVGE
jgi:hypothetical protein